MRNAIIHAIEHSLPKVIDFELNNLPFHSCQCFGMPGSKDVVSLFDHKLVWLPSLDVLSTISMQVPVFSFSAQLLSSFAVILAFWAFPENFSPTQVSFHVDFSDTAKSSSDVKALIENPGGIFIAFDCKLMNELNLFLLQSLGRTLNPRKEGTVLETWQWFFFLVGGI